MSCFLCILRLLDHEAIVLTFVREGRRALSLGRFRPRAFSKGTLTARDNGIRTVRLVISPSPAKICHIGLHVASTLAVAADVGVRSSLGDSFRSS
jgi:hypothetical protein